MRPAEKKMVLEFLRIIHESWVMHLAASFSRDALQEGLRVLTAQPVSRPEAAAAEAWLRRQLEGLGE